MSERWTIIQALSWLATGEALDMRQYIEKGEPDLDQQRVCYAARDGSIKVSGYPGIGARLNGVPREFGHSVQIDPNAFVDASISFYGLSYLRNPRGLSVFYDLKVDRDEFAKWANSGKRESIKSRAKLANVPPKKPGPKGNKTRAIIEQMKTIDRSKLEGMNDEEMVAAFGGVRSTCQNARKIALSEMGNK